MSPDTIAVGVFTIAGTIAGVLVGLFAERFLRSRGDVWCSAGPLRWTFQYEVAGGDFYEQPRNRTMTGLGPVGRGDVAQASWVAYRVDADFYNGRDLPAALRSFEVLFHRPEDTPMGAIPQDGRTWRMQKTGTGNHVPMTDPLKVLNLSPKCFVAVEVKGTVPDPARLAGCDRVELRAVYADGTRFSYDLASLDPSVVLAG